MRRNSHYLVLFDMPMDRTQVKTMSYQMFPSSPHHLLQTYKKAVSKPYGYLVVVSKPNIKQHDRLKTDIFNDDKQNNPEKPANRKVPNKRKIKDDLDKISHLAKESFIEGDPFVENKNMEENGEHSDQQNNDVEKGSEIENNENAGFRIRDKDEQDKPMTGGQAYRLVEISGENYGSSEKLNGQNENEAEIENEADGNPINSSDSDEDVQSSSDNKRDNMHACKYCGSLFEGKYQVVQHEQDCKRWENDQEPFENKGFRYIRQKARERNEDEWSAKVEKYEGQGMTSKEAKNKAEDKMETKDKKTFLKIYENLVRLQVQLGECGLHLELVDHVKELLDVTDLKLEQAVKRAVGKRKRDLETVMDVDDDDSKKGKDSNVKRKKKEDEEEDEDDEEEEDEDEEDNEEEDEEENGDEDEEDDGAEGSSDDSMEDVI